MVTEQASVGKTLRSELHTYIEAGLKRELMHRAIEEGVRASVIIERALNLLFEKDTSEAGDSFSAVKAAAGPA